MILVTGDAGHIGFHTCVELLGAGQDVTVFDNFSNSQPEALAKRQSQQLRSSLNLNNPGRDKNEECK